MKSLSFFKLFLIIACVVAAALLLYKFILPPEVRHEVRGQLGYYGDRLARAKRAYDEFKLKIGTLAVEKPSIVVYKSQRKLVLFMGGQEVFTARVALGWSPVGHKQKEGDGRTPEGDYYVCTRNGASLNHLFLGLSYPNDRDAAEGLRSGLISRVEHDRIVFTTSQKLVPPWKTALGGEIGIHGGGSTHDNTAGCIALNNEDIELLWNFCPIGTPVRIDP